MDIRKEGIKILFVIFIVIAFANDNLLGQSYNLKAQQIVMYDSINQVRYFVSINQNGYLTDYSVSDLSIDTSFKGYFTNPQSYFLSTAEDPSIINGIGFDLDSNNSITIDGNRWHSNGNPFIQIGVVSTSPFVLRFYVYYEDFTLRMTGVLRRRVNNGLVTWNKAKTWMYYGTNGELQKKEVFEE